jgi:hypothetical protein
VRGSTAKKLRFAALRQTGKEAIRMKLSDPSRIARLYSDLNKALKVAWKLRSKPKSLPSLKSIHERRQSIKNSKSG